MKIAVNVDMCLRNTAKQVEYMYEKEYGKNSPEGESFLVFGKYFTFPSVEDYNRFLYQEYVLEIFGQAEEVYANAVLHMNRLVFDMPEHDFILIDAMSSERMVPATFFFLSKTACTVPQVSFFSKMDELLKYDLVVTASQHQLSTLSGTDVRTVKINYDFNDSVEADQEIYRISELKNILENAGELK